MAVISKYITENENYGAAKKSDFQFQYEFRTYISSSRLCLISFVIFRIYVLDSSLPKNSIFPSMQAFIHFTFDLLYPIHRLGFLTSYHLHI